MELYRVCCQESLNLNPHKTSRNPCEEKNTNFGLYLKHDSVIFFRNFIREAILYVFKFLPYT